MVLFIVVLLVIFAVTGIIISGYMCKRIYRNLDNGIADVAPKLQVRLRKENRSVCIGLFIVGVTVVTLITWRAARYIYIFSLMNR